MALKNLTGLTILVSRAADGIDAGLPVPTSVRREKDYAQLNGIVASGQSVHIVGRDTSRRPLILTKRPKGFERVTAPYGSLGAMQDVCAVAAGSDECVAVGYQGDWDSSFYRPLAFRRSGREWNIEETIRADSDIYTMLITTSAADGVVWAGGWFWHIEDDRPTLKPWLIHKPKSEWVVATPKPGAGWFVSSVHAISPENVLVAMGSNGYRGLLFRWDGNTFHLIGNPNISYPPFTNVFAIPNSKEIWLLDFYGDLWWSDGKTILFKGFLEVKEFVGNDLGVVDGKLICVGTDWVGGDAGLRAFRLQEGKWVSEKISGGKGLANPSIAGAFMCASGGSHALTICEKVYGWQRTESQWKRLATSVGK